MPDAAMFVGGASVLIAVGLYAWWRWLRYLRERRARAWPELARRLDGRFRHGSEQQMRISAVVDGRSVIFDGGARRTSIIVPADYCRGLTLFVLRPFHSSLLADMLGLPEVSIEGDPAFDELYLVRASDAHLARAWLDGSTRAAMVAAGAYQWGLDGDKVSAQRDSVEASADQLEQALRATVCLAAAGRRLRERWRALDVALEGSFVASKGSLLDGHIWLVRDGVSLVIDVTAEDMPGAEDDAVGTRGRVRQVLARLPGAPARCSVVTSVRGQLTSGPSARFFVSRAEDLGAIPKRWRRADAEVLPWPYAARVRGSARELDALLTKLVRPALFELQPLVVEKGGRDVALFWEGVVMDEDLLRRASELICALVRAR